MPRCLSLFCQVSALLVRGACQSYTSTLCLSSTAWWRGVAKSFHPYRLVRDFSLLRAQVLTLGTTATKLDSTRLERGADSTVVRIPQGHGDIELHNVHSYYHKRGASGKILEGKSDRTFVLLYLSWWMKIRCALTETAQQGVLIDWTRLRTMGTYNFPYLVVLALTCCDI